MPKTKIHKIFLGLVWTSIVVLFIQVPFSSHAICFGEDGHVLLESAVEGKCCSIDEEHKNEIILRKDSPGEQSDHCGDCVDIILTINDFIKHSQIKHIIQNKNKVLHFLPFHVVRSYNSRFLFNNTYILNHTNNSPFKSYSIVSSTILRI